LNAPPPQEPANTGEPIDGAKAAALPVDSDTPSPAPGFVERLKRHKVIEWTLAYAAVAYTLLHGIEMLSTAQEWPHAVVRTVSLLLVLATPVVAILAWYHGARGLRKISAPELVILTLLLFIAGSLLWMFGGQHSRFVSSPAETAASPATHADSSSSAAPRTAVAVLPFANLTGDSTKEYLGDGMAEELINTLARVPGLKVPARTSTFAYKGRSADIRQIARDLGVGTIVEGSVRAAGKRLRITAQLINAQDGLHLWSEEYDEEFTDIFKLQDTLATQIAQALQPNLSVSAASPIAQPAPTTNVEAYNLYLQGVALLNQVSPANAARAAEHFQQALALDPTFARAYAMIAEAHMVWATLGGRDQAEHHRLAERAAREALARDPDLANAHTALSGIYQGRLQRLEMASHLNAALKIAPNDAFVRVVAAIDTYDTGRLRQAHENAHLAYELAPASGIAVAMLAYMDAMTGEYVDARRLAGYARDLGYAASGYPYAATQLLLALRDKRYADAAVIVDATADRTDPDEARTAEVLRRVFDALQNPEQRAAVLSWGSAHASMFTGFRKLGGCLSGAVSFTLLDAADTAHKLAEICFDTAAPGATQHVAALELMWWAPELRAFRTDPRFQEFCSRLGLTEYWEQYGPPDGCELKQGRLHCH
jgi:TolB-like protein